MIPIGLAACACAGTTDAIEPLSARRPNIVLIITDDQGYGDLGSTGNPIIRTPHLDALAAESVRFTDFHVSPTCAPTRTAVMTGRHEFKSGVTHTIFERERMSLRVTTLPQALRAGGYATGIFGKWHLGDEDAYQPTARGFGEAFIHGAGGIGQTYEGSCGDAPGNRYTDPVIRHNGTFEKTEGYCADLFFDRATRWIEQTVATRPFFCCVTPNTPHAPLDCPPEYERTYSGKVPDPVAKFYGMIANIDDNIGRLRDALRRLGIEKNTLVIFMTDNGSATGSPVYNAGMRGAKGTPYRGGTRVPAFWCWPGTLSPADVAPLTCHWDLFPTLAGIAGVPLDDVARAQIEGRSLIPLLQDAKSPWEDRFFFTHVGRWPHEFDPRDSPETHKFAQCGVRWNRFSLVSNVARGSARWELYDLANDPGESRSVIDSHPDVARAMIEAYDQWWADVLPCLENERVTGPKVNPFKDAYWRQYGGPGPNRVPPP
ncbi:MAG: arylsulfatase [Planctomycetes bacterium]|nr:arylsulfatase [Planctomycetota bacterium]